MYLKFTDPQMKRARLTARDAMKGKNHSTNTPEFAPSTVAPICCCGDAAWPDDFKYCERCGKQLPKLAEKRMAA